MDPTTPTIKIIECPRDAMQGIKDDDPKGSKSPIPSIAFTGGV